MSDTNSALSAASLLLAVLAIVYSAWNSSIQDALDMRFSPNLETRKEEKKRVRGLINTRALPIAIGSWLIAAAFIPRDIFILANTYNCLKNQSCSYDEISVVFILTQLFLVALAIHLSARVKALYTKIKRKV